MGEVDVSKWTRRTLQFAIEAKHNTRLHKARAKRLIEQGLAVMVQGHCVLTLPARDALSKYLKYRGHRRSVK